MIGRPQTLKIGLMRTRALIGILVSVGIVLGSQPRAAAQTLFEEFLDDGSANDSGYLGVQSGGAFVAGGWQTTEFDSRIRFDLDSLGELLDGIACGTVEVEFLNFDPITNLQGYCGTLQNNDDCYSNIIGLYEGDHGSPWTAAQTFETQLQAQATCEQCLEDLPGDLGRDRCIKFKGVSSDWATESDLFNTYLPSSNDVAWESHLDRHYTATFSWSCGRVDYGLEYDGVPLADGSTWAWDNVPVGTRPNIRHLFIGRDFGAGDAWIQGVIFSRVKVSVNAPCDCPDAPVCGDGVIELGEDCEGTDLGGQTCASLGFAGGTLTCTSGCAFDSSDCIALPDAGMDAAVLGDAGDAEDAEVAGDAIPAADAQEAGPSTSGGCGCHAGSAPGSGLLPTLLLALLFLLARRRDA